MDASNRRLSVQQIRKLLYLASLPPGDCIRQSPIPQDLAIAPKELRRLASFAAWQLHRENFAAWQVCRLAIAFGNSRSHRAWQLHSTIPNHAGLGDCAERTSPPSKFCRLAIAFNNPQPRRAWQLRREDLSAWQVCRLAIAFDHPQSRKVWHGTRELHRLASFAACRLHLALPHGLAIARENFAARQVLPPVGCI